MELIPAIDLLDGRVVRLARGRFDAVTSYEDDPVAVARRWRLEQVAGSDDATRVGITLRPQDLRVRAVPR